MFVKVLGKGFDSILKSKLYEKNVKLELFLIDSSSEKTLPFACVPNI